MACSKLGAICDLVGQRKLDAYAAWRQCRLAPTPSWLRYAPVSPAAACSSSTLHCATVGHRVSARAISIVERNAPLRVPAVPRKSDVWRAHAWMQLQGALVTKFTVTARFARSRFPTAYRLQLVAASAQVLRKIGAPCAVRSRPARCACTQGGHHLAQIGTNMRL